MKKKNNNKIIFTLLFDTTAPCGEFIGWMLERTFTAYHFAGHPWL